jgi:hypothetical protein
MMTAHDRIRAAKLLPMAPYELLLDTETEQVVVAWPDLSPAASIVYLAGSSSDDLTALEPHHAWVEDHLGPDRAAEVRAAVSAAVDDHWTRVERIKRIYQALDGEARS